MHVLPLLVFQIFNILTDSRIPVQYLFVIVNYPINIFSALFHLLHLRDLISIICTYSPKKLKSTITFNPISLAITMSMYQLTINLTTSIINLIFYDKFYLLAILLNFIILTVYYSFYCFNNLWQYNKKEMFYRIDMHEKLWPYYCGFGTIATIIYFNVANPYILGLYNMYMCLITTLPFLLTIRYPNADIKYPQINLTIFSYITNSMFIISKSVLRLFSH